MSVIDIGSPAQAFMEAVLTELRADTSARNGTGALMTLVTGVYGHLSEAARTTPPYLLLGECTKTKDAVIRNIVTLQIDGWSAAKDRREMTVILSRVTRRLQGATLRLGGGFEMFTNGLDCEFEQVFFEPDLDKPESGFYRGIQRWVSMIGTP